MHFFVTEELSSLVDKKGLLEDPNMVSPGILGTKDILLRIWAFGEV